jgi:hypothetical protein
MSVKYRIPADKQDLVWQKAVRLGLRLPLDDKIEPPYHIVLSYLKSIDASYAFLSDLFN